MNNKGIRDYEFYYRGKRIGKAFDLSLAQRSEIINLCKSSARFRVENNDYQVKVGNQNYELEDLPERNIRDIQNGLGYGDNRINIAVFAQMSANDRKIIEATYFAQNITQVANELHLSRHAVTNSYNRIKEKTGLDPRIPCDLIPLYNTLFGGISNETN